MGEKIQLFHNTEINTYTDAVNKYKIFAWRYGVFNSLLWATFIIHILDCISTVLGIYFYDAIEQNPFMDYMFMRFDVGLIMVLSIIVFFFCNKILLNIFIKYPKCNKAYTIVFVIIMYHRLLILFSNCSYIMDYIYIYK